MFFWRQILCCFKESFQTSTPAPALAAKLLTARVRISERGHTKAGSVWCHARKVNMPLFHNARAAQNNAHLHRMWQKLIYPIFSSVVNIIT